MKVTIEHKVPYSLNFEHVLRVKGVYLSSDGTTILTLGNGHSYFYHDENWYTFNVEPASPWRNFKYQLLDGSVTFQN